MRKLTDEFMTRCYNQPWENPMIVDPQTINNLIMAGAAWGLAFMVALWLSLIFWTYRDIRSRSRDQLLRVLAIVVVGILFLPGIVIYLILRPAHTLEEEYQQTLEEEALLQSIEDNPVCPGCGRKTQDTWIVCPSCQTRLRKPCHQCRKLMELSWNLCPYCGTPAPGKRQENKTMDDVTRPAPLEEPAQQAGVFTVVEPFMDDEKENGAS
jgi:RNA polymerase subunit RPABC4/transcription elongation factor Spt4